MANKLNPWMKQRIGAAEKQGSPLKYIIEVQPGTRESVLAQFRALPGLSILSTPADRYITVDLPTTALLSRIESIPEVVKISAETVYGIRGTTLLTGLPPLKLPSVFDPWRGDVGISKVEVDVGLLEGLAKLPLRALASFEEKVFTTDQVRQLLGVPKENKINTRVAVLDSVPYYSPVIIRLNDNLVNILTIEDLWGSISEEILLTEKGEEIKTVSGISCYNGVGRSEISIWSGIKKIIRHWYKGEIIRINTVGSIVDVSPNHSIYRRYGNSTRTELVDAKEIKVGDRLMMHRIETPQKPQYTFVGTEDLAWLYGAFVGDGSAFEDKSGYSGEVRFVNADRELIEKFRAIYELNYHHPTRLSNRLRQDGIYYLTLGESRTIIKHFKDRFYTSTGKKSIPVEILNAPKRIKRAFLRGYWDADGYKSSRMKSEFGSFSTNSWVLAAQILWLLREVSDQAWTLYTREDKPDIIQICLTDSAYTINEKVVREAKHNVPAIHLKDRAIVKKIQRIPYEGYLYDLETENHRFITGIGGIMVHNTGGIKFPHPLMHLNTKVYLKSLVPGELPIDGMSHGSWVQAAAFGDDFTHPRWGRCEGVADAYEQAHFKVLSNLGFGMLSWILDGIYKAYEWGAKLVSMSLGGPLEGSAIDDDPTCRLVNDLSAKGVLFVIAAGNEGVDNSIGSPGAAPSAITVGSWGITRNALAGFSSRGPSGEFYRDHPDIWQRDLAIAGEDLRKVDLVCYGGDDLAKEKLLSAGMTWYGPLTDPIPGFSLMHGTSMSTPIAAGMIALALDRGYIKSAAEVRAKLKRYWTGEKSESMGYGLLTFAKLMP